jgi:hypothetical protein
LLKKEPQAFGVVLSPVCEHIEVVVVFSFFLGKYNFLFLLHLGDCI